MDNYEGKTFLGGGRLSVRTTLFFLFGVFALVSAAGGLFIADKRLSTAQSRLMLSRELADSIFSVEKIVWNIRIEEKDFFLRKNPQHINSHKINADLLSARLNALYSLLAAAPIKEHITTINEGLAQYTAEFANAVAAQGVTGKAGGLADGLREAAHNVESRIANTRITLLIGSLATIREHEKEFVRLGEMQDIVKLNKSIDEFAALLASAKLPEEDKALIGNLLKSYQDSITAFAKSRLKRDREISRLDEIFAYIAPSINGLVTFAGNNLIEASKEEQQLRRLYRLSLPAGGAAIVLALMLFGLIMMRSIISPVKDIAITAITLADGNKNVGIPALGNKDETGDIARALARLRLGSDEALRREDKEDKNALAEIERLRSELEIASEKTRKGEAAMAEATRLRMELETHISTAGNSAAAAAEADALRKELDETKKELMKGETALIEAALLRIDLEATKAELAKAADEAKSILESKEKEAAVVNLPTPQLTPEKPQPVASDTLSAQITIASRQLARSSQNVSEAAYEAERTGALINGLADVAGKINELDALLAVITNQTNFLVPQTDAGELKRGETDSSLLALTADYKKAVGQKLKETKDDAIGQRFDAIRATTRQATWTVKDIADIISEIKEIASAIAAASSTEAMEITAELLAQSEQLREMLDSLVANIQRPGNPHKAPSKN